MEELTESSRSHTGRTRFITLTALLFAAFAFQLIYHAVRASPTVDEPFHILAGHRHWQCGDFGINPEHPPLLKLLAAAPLKFRQLSEPPWECGSKITPKFDGFSYGSTFLVENGIDSVVIATRVTASLLSMLLALLVFLAAWEMFLGLALARGGQRDEARSELDKAAELAKTDVRFRNQEVRARLELGRLRF